MQHPIHALTAEIQRDYDAKGWAPQLICEAWTAKSLGLAIKQAIASGTDWTSTAEHLADRMSLKPETGQ